MSQLNANFGTLLLAALLAGGDQLAELKNQYARQRQEFQQRIERAGSAEDRQQILTDMRLRQAEFSERFLEIARPDPASPEALEALTWVVANDFVASPQALESLKLLAAHHLASDSLAEVCQRLIAWAPNTDAEQFLRQTMQSPSRRAAGFARYSLALSLQQAADPTKRTEAESLLNELALNYADVPGIRANLAEAARAQLFELRNLSVGSSAPEIVGEDLEGKPLRLSDHRGRVLLLSFWGSWCPQCVDNLPHEQRLVERLKGKPFVLLGVDTDSDSQVGRQFALDQRMSWRSWYDGDMATGPIAAQWNVVQWPMTYLIDHEGIIRAKFHGPFPVELDAAVDQLVANVPLQAAGIGVWAWLLGGGLFCVLVAVLRLWGNRVPGPVKI